MPLQAPPQTQQSFADLELLVAIPPLANRSPAWSGDPPEFESCPAAPEYSETAEPVAAAARSVALTAQPAPEALTLSLEHLGLGNLAAEVGYALVQGGMDDPVT